MTDKIEVPRDIAYIADALDIAQSMLERSQHHPRILGAYYKAAALLREAAQPNIGQRKTDQLKQRGMVPIGTILQDPSTGRRATVDDYGRVQWWAVTGSGEMAHDECCNAPAQCWEPCGDLGKSTEHAQPAPVAPNSDEVICPACCHQFRAIPVSVQQMMLDAGFEPPFMSPPDAENLARLRADAERLDFVLAEDAFIYSQLTDAGVTVFQLWNQDEDENFHVLSGEGKFLKTTREAIDAAIAAQKEN